MDDMTGKKFSLQDWVTRRAANQSGGVAARASAAQSIEPLSIKKTVNGDETIEPQSVEEVVATTSSSQDDVPAPLEIAPEAMKVSSDPVSKDVMGKIEGRPNPIQQLQIVRLLSDLGERLRQSEKEREILWKEIEMCRKQIGDLETKNSVSEKAYQSLEGQFGEKDDFIKGLLSKQSELENLLKTQTDVIEQSKSDNAKFEERLDQKLSGIETATGSAIVRIEDALEENNKLSKRIEQLSQDKARLSRKLEVMEETLTQTQETLKAKALVLLTDQALAARTSLPQAPAWTGDDTIRVSKPKEEGRDVQSNGLVSDIAGSIKQGAKGKTSDMNNTAFLAALVVLGIAGGVLFSQLNFSSIPSIDWSSADKTKTVDAVDQTQPVENASGDELLEPPNQEVLMADIAKLANQIEPAATSEDPAKSAGGVSEKSAQDQPEYGEFAKAIEAEDTALEKFHSEAPKGNIHDRIKSDRALPKAVREIEAKAFSGDASAQQDLAAVYIAGHMGVKVNYDRAIKWFTEAAYHNPVDAPYVANAQYNLGVLYHQGLGATKDIAKAIDLYRVAAANGHPEAQYNLAIAYIEGVGVEYNPQVAAVYFQKAAADGVVEAAYNLGLLHENGLLGESQPDEAVFWYTLAADKGDKQAKAALDQIKTQLSMSDDDARRIVERIVQTKPGFAGEDGKAALPESVEEKSQESGSADNEATPSLGMSDADRATVTQVQEYLIRLGIYKGMATGEMSTSLSDAIKSYQKANGLKEDGFPSDTLLVHMLANETLPAAGE